MAYVTPQWHDPDDPPVREPKPDGLHVLKVEHAAAEERKAKFIENSLARETTDRMSIRQIVLHRKHPYGDQWLSAFKHGLKRHGKKAIWSNRFESRIDLAILWGASQHELIMKYSGAGIPYIILEMGFVSDRMNYASAGYGGINGHADFRNVDSPDDRAAIVLRCMSPWTIKGSMGDYVLIMGQVQGDQSVRGVNLSHWYADTAKFIAGRGFHVAFRPHPKGSSKDCPPAAELLLGELPQALSHAHVVVTYNSNAGVDAVLSGIPTIAVDKGSMALPIASRNLNDIADPPRPDRTQWASNIAYAQWREEEFRSGRVWEHLAT